MEADYVSLLRATKTPNKNRRFAPFNWITGPLAMVARTLFGVATDEDVQRLMFHVNNLYKQGKHLATLQTMQLTALQNIDNQVQRQSNHLSSLVNLTGLLFATVMPDATQRQRLTPTILLLQGELAATISEFKDTIEQYHDAVHKLDHGILSPDLIPPIELTKILDHVTQQLPTHLHLAFPNTPDELDPYYRSEIMQLLPGNQSIRAILHIPVYDQHDIYTTYYPRPTPSRTPHNPIQRYQWDGQVTQIIINHDHTRFMETNTITKDLPCLAGPPKVCPRPMAAITDPHHNCLFRLLTNTAETRQSEPCPLTIIPQTAVTVTPLDQTHWLITTNQNITIQSTCLDMPNNPKQQIQQPNQTLHGDAILTVPSHCDTQLPGIYISLTTQFSSSADIPTPQKTTHKSNIANIELVYQVQHTENSIHQQFLNDYHKLSELQKNIDQGTRRHTTYEDIQQEIQAATTKQHLAPIWITHYISIFGWCLFVILVGVIMTLVCTYRHKIGIWRREMDTLVPDHFTPRMPELKSVTYRRAVIPPLATIDL